MNFTPFSNIPQQGPYIRFKYSCSGSTYNSLTLSDFYTVLGVSLGDFNIYPTNGPVTKNQSFTFDIPYTGFTTEYQAIPTEINVLNDGYGPQFGLNRSICRNGTSKSVRSGSAKVYINDILTYTLGTSGQAVSACPTLTTQLTGNSAAYSSLKISDYITVEWLEGTL
jgi:hypothetical protein